MLSEWQPLHTSASRIRIRKGKFKFFIVDLTLKTFSLAVPTLFCILSQINPVHTHIRFNILPYMRKSSPYVFHAMTIFLTEVNNTYINKYLQWMFKSRDFRSGDFPHLFQMRKLFLYALCLPRDISDFC
jgi:hypothetical protein